MPSSHYATARETIGDLVAGRISARECLDMAVVQNAQVTTKLNCVVNSDIEAARKAAQKIDDARARGAATGVLAGLPMTIKDGFDVAGMPALAGNPALKDRAKDCADADLVRRVKQEGAVVWGKTNVPLMLGDFQSYNAIYGTTNNPYDVSRTPGGSSGGAATALAAGITALEIGSDIGGSLRHPANFCGVLSLKPTWGTLSDRGHVPPLPGEYAPVDLGVMGPMARNAGDLRLLWNLLRGSAGAPQKDIAGLRIAVWDEEPGYPLAREVRAHVRKAAQALVHHGAAVDERRLPLGGEELMVTYAELLLPIFAAMFPPSVYDSFMAAREADLRAMAEGADTYSAAAYRVRSTASYRDFVRATVRRQAMKDRMAEFFASGIDAILCPISPLPAFPHSQDLPPIARTLDVDGGKVPYMTMLNWIALATALHLPAMAVPAGQTSRGLPVGVQLVGAWHQEDRLFDLAHVLEQELGGFSAPHL